MSAKCPACGSDSVTLRVTDYQTHQISEWDPKSQFVEPVRVMDSYPDEDSEFIACEDCGKDFNLDGTEKKE